jgi:outer membrane protein assembly factor BamB
VPRRLLALAVIAALAGCAGAERPGGAPFVRLDVGENLGTMAAGGRDVWVNDFGREELLRVDGRSGRVLARLRLGRRVALAVTREAVWALRWGGRFFRTPSGPLYRIDPSTGRVERRIPLGDDVAFGVLAGESYLWVWGPRQVVMFERYSGTFVGGFHTDDDAGELTGAVVDDDGLLATTADGDLLHLGSDGKRVVRRSPALVRAELLAVDRGIALAAAVGALVAVDVRTGRLRWRRPLGFRISTLLRREGILLVQGAAFRDAGDRLWAIDTATGRVLASATVPSFGTTSMVHAGGGLWFATSAGEMIVMPPLITRLFLARADAARSGRH